MSNNNRILVVGAAGMLGSELVQQLSTDGRDVIASCWPSGLEGQIQLDITDRDAILRVFDNVRPNIVFNCAAFTNVDGAEADESLATAVNGSAVGNLAAACKKSGASLVHVSTDYVFDGCADKPYQPSCPPSPRTAYGRSKLAGEQLLRESSCRGLIVRTSWLFGRGGKNFVDTIVGLAARNMVLRVVDDQRGCPSYAGDLASCLIELSERNCDGIWHFCNPPACSWFDLATEAVRLAGCDCLVQPCSSAEYPRPAKRPVYSVLDCSATFDFCGRSARPWQQALLEHLGSKLHNTKGV